MCLTVLSSTLVCLARCLLACCLLLQVAAGHLHGRQLIVGGQPVTSTAQ